MAFSAHAIRAGQAFIELTANDAKLQQGLKRAQIGLATFKKQADQLGSTLLQAGKALATPLHLSAKIFAEYSDQISLVRAVAKGTKEELDALDATAKKLGATTSFTASQVAELMVELGRGGMAAAEINAATQGVLDLARATGTETGTTAGIVVAALRAFNLEASESQRVADVLTAAANGSFNTLESLGEAFTYAGVTAAQAGMSIEETAAILMALGNVGIQGSMAGTTLKRLLTINAAEAQKLQEIFGVTFRDAAGNARPLVDVFEEINAALEGLGSGERAAKMNEAFGLLGITGAEVIANTSDQIRQFTAELENAEGTARRVAQDMDDNLGGSWRMMMSAIEGVAIAIGESLTPTLREWAKQIELSSGQLGEWIRQNEDIIVSVATWTAGVLAAGAGLKALGVILGGFAMAIGGVSKALKALRVAAKLAFSHPLIAGIGLAAAVAAWYLFSDSLGEATAAAQKFADTQTRLREEGDKLRQQHQAMFDRLQQLAAAQALSTAEHDEAQQIVSALTAAYGDLGIEIDHATSKLVNLAAAQARLTAAQRQARISELEREAAALRDLAAAQRAQADASSGGLSGWWREFTARFGRGWDWSVFRGDPLGQDDATIAAEGVAAQPWLDTLRRLTEINAQIEALRQGAGQLWEEDKDAAQEVADAAGKRVEAEAQVVEQLKQQRDLMKEMQAFERGRRHTGDVAEAEAAIARLEAELEFAAGPDTPERRQELEQRLLEIDHQLEQRQHDLRAQLTPAEQEALHLEARKEALEEERAQRLARRDAELAAAGDDEAHKRAIMDLWKQFDDAIAAQLDVIAQEMEELPDVAGIRDRLGNLGELGELMTRRQALEKQLAAISGEAETRLDGSSRGTFNAAAAARGLLFEGDASRDMVSAINRSIQKQEEIRKAIIENRPRVE